MTTNAQTKGRTDRRKGGERRCNSLQNTAVQKTKMTLKRDVNEVGVVVFSKYRPTEKTCLSQARMTGYLEYLSFPELIFTTPGVGSSLDK